MEVYGFLMKGCHSDGYQLLRALAFVTVSVIEHMKDIESDCNFIEVCRSFCFFLGIRHESKTLINLGRMKYLTS